MRWELVQVSGKASFVFHFPSDQSWTIYLKSNETSIKENCIAKQWLLSLRFFFSFLKLKKSNRSQFCDEKKLVYYNKPPPSFKKIKVFLKK